MVPARGLTHHWLCPHYWLLCTHSLLALHSLAISSALAIGCSALTHCWLCTALIYHWLYTHSLLALHSLTIGCSALVVGFALTIASLIVGCSALTIDSCTHSLLVVQAAFKDAPKQLQKIFLAAASVLRRLPGEHRATILYVLACW